MAVNGLISSSLMYPSRLLSSSSLQRALTFVDLRQAAVLLTKQMTIPEETASCSSSQCLSFLSSVSFLTEPKLCLQLAITEQPLRPKKSTLNCFWHFWFFCCDKSTQSTHLQNLQKSTQSSITFFFFQRISLAVTTKTQVKTHSVVFLAKTQLRLWRWKINK